MHSVMAFEKMDLKQGTEDCIRKDGLIDKQIDRIEAYVTGKRADVDMKTIIADSTLFFAKNCENTPKNDTCRLFAL